MFIIFRHYKFLLGLYFHLCLVAPHCSTFGLFSVSNCHAKSWLRISFPFFGSGDHKSKLNLIIYVYIFR